MVSALIKLWQDRGRWVTQAATGGPGPRYGVCSQRATNRPLTEDTMTQQIGDSYPKLRQVLGDDAFAELAQLIRKTYEANEARRQRPARRDRAQPSPGA